MAGSPQDQPVIEAIKTRISAGDLAGARAACEAFLASVSDSVRQSPVRAWLGMVEQRVGALPAAIEQYELALQSDRHNPRLQVQLGLAYFQLKNLDRAEQLYRDALRAEPQLALAHYNLGILLQDKRDLPAARRAFESAIALQPQFPEALTNLANTLVELKELERAGECYRQALAFNPRLATAHRGMALLYLRLQQRGPATRSLEAAVTHDPSLLDAWLDLADCYHLEGDNARAIACVDQVLARDPDNETARFERALYAGEQPETAPAPMLEKLFDAMASDFDEHLTGRLGYRVPGQLVEALTPWLYAFNASRGHGPTVLDLGCGTGLFGEAVRPFAAKLIGVDLSGAMLDKARARNVYDELAEDELMSWLAAHPQPADLIAATDVLIYVGKLDSMFAEVARHLPSQGVFAFSTESPPGLADDYRLVSGGRYSHSVAYIERLAAVAGLAIGKRVDTVIRTENGQPVEGYLFVLHQP